MPTVVRSSLLDILPAVQQQLMTVIGYGAEQVLIADPFDIVDTHPQGDAYLCLWIDNADPDFPCFDGGGRTDTRVTETLAVTIRTRCGLDNSQEASAWLADRVLGHAAVRRQVWDALVAFLPADTTEENSGDILVTDPMVPRNGSRPRRLADKDWGESTLLFSLKYEMDLNQEWQ